MFTFKNISLRIRIFFAMILLIVMATVLIVTVTVYQYDEQSKEYNISRFGRKEEQAKESIEIELENKTTFPVTTENLPKIFNERIYEISTILNVEISMYNLKGEYLISSKSSTLYDSVQRPISLKILSEINGSINHRILKINEVETMSFETSYSYLFDVLGKPIGILKLEFTQDNSDQERELNEFLSRLSVVYFFMLIIAIAFAYFISSYITRSLQMVTNKMHQTRLNKRNEKIILEDKSSEVNILVEAYNNMIDELEESAVKLAQSEREQAWREMAKQVAHEIKNPLTPMRLSVQSFERRFDANDPNIKEKMREFSETLIQQIDVMSSIATAFSDFAKMPKQKKETIEVISVVKHALDIFNENYISYNPKIDEVYGHLDKTQLIRIITNLVTNAIQAVEDKETPKIVVEVTDKNNNIVISVTDNGKGIKEEVEELIFEPKFTTKSSGMGLGLPMIKNIIEAYQGSINFTSEEGVGTTFTVTLPKK